MTRIEAYDETDGPEQVPLLYRIIHWPLTVVHIVFDFVLQYLFRRPWILLPSAIPAIVTALIAVAVVAWCSFQPDTAVVARIEDQLREAIEAEDLAGRHICLNALLQRDPKSSFYRFQYASLLREDGQDRAGRMLLEELVADGDTGYPPAHRLLGEEALKRYEEAASSSDKEILLRTAIRHLVALGKDREPRLDYHLGMLYVDDGDLSLAEVHLRQVAQNGYAAAQIALSRLYQLRGNIEAASALRKEARRNLESYVGEHPNDLDARLAWAQCLLEESEWANLTRVLTELERLDANAAFRNRLAHLALAASEAQPLANPLAAERAIEYARWAFPLLVDRKTAVWRLTELAFRGLDVPSDAIEETRKWLDQAAERQPEDASLWLLRARFAELAGEPRAAEKAYERAAELTPDSLPEFASFHRRQENSEPLAEVSRQVIDHFRLRLSENADDAVARAALAEAYADQGHWEEARLLLSATDGGPQLQLAMAGICIREFDAMVTTASGSSDASLGAQLVESPDGETNSPPGLTPPYDLLWTALVNVPNYGPALQRLESEMYRENTTGGDVLHRHLLETLAKGEQPAVIHTLLGLRATWLEDWTTAVRHYEQAIRLLPNNALLHNNIAYSLLKAEASNIQLKRAKSLATAGLRLAPGHPEILATRGEILLRLKEYEAAAVDLEKALKLLQRRSALHQLLGECYDELGLTSLAGIHREKAGEIDSQGDGC